MTLTQKSVFLCKLGRLIILCLGVRDFTEREIKLIWFQTNLSLFVHPRSTLLVADLVWSNKIPKGVGEGVETPMLINGQVRVTFFII